jgi:hypothetical protein
MTANEIVIETVLFYNRSNRGYEEAGSACRYYTEEGNKCAVGRCLSEEGLATALDVEAKNGNSLTVSDLHDACDIGNLLKPEYRGQTIEFWKHLQYLHDCGGNWTDRGISQGGLRSIEKWFGYSVLLVVEEALKAAKELK